jgi:hypothetical protein
MKLPQYVIAKPGTFVCNPGAKNVSTFLVTLRNPTVALTNPVILQLAEALFPSRCKRVLKSNLTQI